MSRYISNIGALEERINEEYGNWMNIEYNKHNELLAEDACGRDLKVSESDGCFYISLGAEFKVVRGIEQALSFINWH